MCSCRSLCAGEIDALFVDGCHLYECVKEDLDLWIPKLRRGKETLVLQYSFDFDQEHEKNHNFVKNTFFC